MIEPLTCLECGRRGQPAEPNCPNAELVGSRWLHTREAAWGPLHGVDWYPLTENPQEACPQCPSCGGPDDAWRHHPKQHSVACPECGDRYRIEKRWTYEIIF